MGRRLDVENGDARPMTTPSRTPIETIGEWGNTNRPPSRDDRRDFRMYGSTAFVGFRSQSCALSSLQASPGAGLPLARPAYFSRWRSIVHGEFSMVVGYMIGGRVRRVLRSCTYAGRPAPSSGLVFCRIARMRPRRPLS